MSYFLSKGPLFGKDWCIPKNVDPKIVIAWPTLTFVDCSTHQDSTVQLYHDNVGMETLLNWAAAGILFWECKLVDAVFKSFQIEAYNSLYN